MSFDPSTNAAVLAALVARCDFAQFTIVTQALTTFRNLGHPYQSTFNLVPGAMAMAIWFTAVYRGVRRIGPKLIVDSKFVTIGTAAVLDHAVSTLDALDLEASRDGANPNPYAPR